MVEPSEAGQIAIAFDGYVSGMYTRASVNTVDSIAKGNGVGIFAMYNGDGKKYDPTVADGSAVTTFSDNLMQNTNLVFSNTSTVTPAITNWSYAPLRYWPIKANEYVSFLAYAPYSNSVALYTKDANGMKKDGDNAVYLKYDVSSDKSKMVDLLYNDASTTANMQYNPEGGTSLVHLNLKHACARISIEVTSSALTEPLSEYYEERNVLHAGADGKEYTTRQITINKLILLGDNTSAQGASPTGAFHSTGYLNLGIQTSEQPLWVADDADGKVAITYSELKDKTISGYRTAVTTNADGTFTGEGGVTNVANDKAGYLFIVPQDFSTGVGNKLFCYVDYSVKDIKQNTATNVTGYVPIKQNFEAGKAYLITLDLGLGGEIHQHTITNLSEEDAQKQFLDP